MRTLPARHACQHRPEKVSDVVSHDSRPPIVPATAVGVAVQRADLVHMGRQAGTVYDDVQTPGGPYLTERRRPGMEDAAHGRVPAETGVGIEYPLEPERDRRGFPHDHIA